MFSSNLFGNMVLILEGILKAKLVDFTDNMSESSTYFFTRVTKRYSIFIKKVHNLLTKNSNEFIIRDLFFTE